MTNIADFCPPRVDTTDYKTLYLELIYQVCNKYPGESRHETALRYIKEREDRHNYNKPAKSAA